MVEPVDKNENAEEVAKETSAKASPEKATDASAKPTSPADEAAEAEQVAATA